MNYDLIVIGSGPGGYVAAIRASQLGMNVALVERSEVGGICLNWGCIPTKALLKSAQVYNYLKHSDSYGISISGEVLPDINKMVSRSREVADNMSKGIQFLLKKYNIPVIKGEGKLLSNNRVEVSIENGDKIELESKNIILATGARSRELPNIKQDGSKVIGYRQALTLDKIPKTMIVIGSGAIGSEFAYFYNSIGVKVYLVEFMPNIVPNEDDDVSKQLERSFKKQGMKIYKSSSVESVEIENEICKVSINTKKGIEIIEADLVLSAVGITTNIENIGLEENNIETNKGKIIVDDYYKTNVDNIFAIGDIVKGPSLAHVASHEALICVEKIALHNPETLDYNNIPCCTYTSPEIASVGYTEKQALELGYELKVGKFPFTASGKATASGNRDGFVKIIFDANTDLILGCHMVGDNVTEMISEIVVARKLKTKAQDIINSIHPHPTMSEAVMEAAAIAYSECVHLIET